ncbi:hypothetical protein M0802_000577 [Mischocyttarus mexicanus]|nr:hypothetical protein M0802_000577 [Mischocyttarus mexicanus]
MAKLLLFLTVTLLALTYVMACSPPGMPCTDNSQCCAPFVCNPWASRCTKAGNWPQPGASTDSGVFGITIISIAMKKFVFLTFLAIIAIVLAAPELKESTVKCSPWLGLCHTSSDCCRNLICLSYAAKCVSKPGVIIPGGDNRPIGPPPYPPTQYNIIVQ